MARTPQSPSPDIPEDLEDLDPGLAEERTRLAWLRTTVAFCAVSVGVLKFDPLAGVPLIPMAGGVWVVGLRHGRTGRERRATHPRRTALGFIALTVVITALVALVVALTGAGVTHGLTYQSAGCAPDSRAAAWGDACESGLSHAPTRPWTTTRPLHPVRLDAGRGGRSTVGAEL